MKQTEEELFKGHHEMMNVWQIAHEVDTFNLKINEKYANLKNQFNNYFLSRTFHSMGISKNQLAIHEFYKTLNTDDFRRSVESAQNLARSSSSYIDSTIEEVRVKNFSIIDYMVGWHKKINISFACIVLFFVGAPLGAIIRKGGMGLPVVVAVLFFLLYYVVTIIFEDLVMEEVYSIVFGTWFPLMLFLPIGIFLTYKAAVDSALFDIYSYIEPIKKLFKRQPKTTNENPPAV
jgi:lipopolysaccharide export system permease protein